MTDMDLLIEAIAARLEEPSFGDIMGIGAKKKRDREDAALRMRTRQEQRHELADWVRSFKSDRGNSMARFLEEVREAEGEPHDFAWGPDVACALAQRWVELSLSLTLNTHLANCAPTFSLRLTDRGRERLASLRGEQPPTEEARA